MNKKSRILVLAFKPNAQIIFEFSKRVSFPNIKLQTLDKQTILFGKTKRDMTI